jgi:alkaline phosphatase D
MTTKPLRSSALASDPASPGLPRRAFLRMGGAAMITFPLVAACGDDGATASGGTTDGGTTDGGTSTTTGSGTTTGSSSGSSTTGSGTTGSSTSSSSTDPGTTDPTSSTTGSTTDDPSTTSSTTSSTTGDDTGMEVAFDPEAIPENTTLFPAALMGGEMKPESFHIATYVDDGQPQTLRVWRPSQTAGNVVLVAEKTVTPDVDGFVKDSVDGLAPGTWYSYALFSGPADAFTGRSIISEVRTALAPGVLEPLTIAITSCNGEGYNPQSGSGPDANKWSLDVVADEYYDMFIHLGDQVYHDTIWSQGGTRPDYLAGWLYHLRSDSYRLAYSRAGMYATWDDHEVSDNSDVQPWSLSSGDQTKLDNAIDTFFTVMPVDPVGGIDGVEKRLWRSFRWGDTAEIIVLDCRYERTGAGNGGGKYISDAQMAFLKDRLQNSPCRFKVVMTSVPITNMPFIWDVAGGDRWEGYAASRNELKDFINANDLPGIWMIGGDFHVNFVSRIEPMGNDRWSGIREIAVTGGNTNPLGATLTGGQYVFGNGSPQGCLLTFDPMTDTVTVRYLNEDGSEAFTAELTEG